MNSRKGFFQHPKLVHAKKPKPTFSPSKLSAEELERVKKRLVDLKNKQIEEKKAKLQEMRAENRRLSEAARNYETTALLEREQLQEEQRQLDDKLAEVNSQIVASQQLENIEVDEYIEWRYTIAKEKHFEKVEELRKKYSEENTIKIEKISQLNGEIEVAKQQLRQVEELRKAEADIIVEEEVEQEIMMPNVRAIGAEIGYLREKIRSLKESKKIIIGDLKEQLNSGTWSVKETFEACKDRIGKEIKRLLSYLDKPEKEILKASTEKVPNPISLIEAYETRLSALEEKLPEELRTEQVLKCLRPLPWRSIKGSGVDPSTSATAEIHQKFNRLQRQFVEAEDRNKQLKQSLREKDTEIDRLMQTLKGLQEQSKQLRR